MTNVLPPSRCVRAGSIGSALNAAKLVVGPASPPPPPTGDDDGGAVLESRRERRERVGVYVCVESGGGRRFIDDGRGGETDVTTAAARGSARRGGLEAEEEADVGRFGDTLRRVLVVEERGLCTVGEVLLLPVMLGVSRDTTYGPVGEAGISTLLRTE